MTLKIGNKEVTKIAIGNTIFGKEYFPRKIKIIRSASITRPSDGMQVTNYYPGEIHVLTGIQWRENGNITYYVGDGLIIDKYDFEEIS
ncbi:hypothetical protein [Lactobacillus sp. LL6]|uniref:hypothetical protein n=1 Tax=Lactobacillus sp. LL6 TaxID=2596827 RepID=UPI001186174E|nr:hypothetical protein [Lactobacillus sp. LL6]TSO25282.1 hypothetical protein FOD82_08565 [Lactobacillus sp. LL6]